MTKRLTLSVGLIGLCAIGISGCVGFGGTSETGRTVGTTGFDAYSQADYKTADDVFEAENQRYPNDPMVEFNLADTYAATGRREEAVRYYQLAVLNGKDTYPTIISEAPSGSHESLADAACEHLTTMNVGCR